MEKVLDSGRLNGCDLRGNVTTSQFGIVSNRPLPNDTIVAVECGIVWSEPEHDAVIKDAGDPLLGLASNVIPSPFLRELATNREWKAYKKACGGGRTAPGIIIECSAIGNETRHIDDPAWAYMSDSNIIGTNVPQHNLESRVVLDFKRKLITCVFETTRDVLNKTELTMDWGCWGSICDHMLPGQAQASRLLYGRNEALVKVAAKHEVSTDDITGDLAIIGQQQLYFDAKQSVFAFLKDHLPGQSNINYNVGINSLGKEFEILRAIAEHQIADETFDYDDYDANDWCRVDNEAVDLEFAGVHHATRSTDFQRLSRPARSKMDGVPREAYTAFDKVRVRLDENYRTGVEVVEITDPRNPAKLFALPGQPARGLRTKKNFRKNSPVMAYGGIIEQLDENSSRNAFFFGVGLPEEYDGPSLFIDGSRSIGGLVNDPWSPPGFPKREANVVAIEHWDIETNTPQIAFYALKNIRRGEELLYHYGREYWKVAWISLMRDHAEYATKAAIRCRSIRERIANEKNVSEDEVVEWEKEYLFDVV